MKSRDQEGELNLKLIQILERIKNKLDKHSVSRKTGSPKTHEKKGRSRSVTRHHCHSPKHSNKRAHSNSIPYPTRNHRISGVDELKGEMNKIKKGR
jgi:hypothetical protein